MDPGKSDVEHCVAKVVHAFKCTNANCKLLGCARIKHALIHTRFCKSANRNCLISKKLLAHCYYHAKHCQESKCSAVFCLRIKNKIKQYHQEQQQAQLLRRRMAGMNIAARSGEAGPSTAMDFQPGSQVAPVHFIQEEVLMQEGSPQMPSNPQNAAAPLLQAMLPPGESGASVPLIPFIEPPEPNSQNLVEMPRATIGISVEDKDAMLASTVEDLLISEQRHAPPLKKQALQHLQKALKDPSNPQQTEKILIILKSNLERMDSFLKEEKEYVNLTSLDGGEE